MLVTRSVLLGLRKLFWFNRCFPLRVLDLLVIAILRRILGTSLDY